MDRGTGTLPKRYVKVRRDGKQVEALIYILIAGKPQNKPSAFYYSTLLEGYRAAGFDTEILKAAVLGESADKPIA